MKKTSLYLDSDLDAALARRAEQEGLSKAEFVRRGLRQLVDPPQRVKPRAIGVSRSDALPADLSSRDEEYLDESFGA